MVAAEIKTYFKDVQEAYDKLKESKKSEKVSLLKKHLNDEIFNELKDLKTPKFKCGLLDVIQSGCVNLDSGVGVYAPDIESYETFRRLFDPIIKDYHGIEGEIKHPPMDFGDVAQSLGDIDPSGKYVISTRCRVARSFTQFPLAPSMNRQQYLELEDLVRNACQKFDQDLAGQFHSLASMDRQLQDKLIDEHFLFKEGDRYLEAANALRFWPDGRAIFLNESRSFIIWVGEEDHLRIISMQKGGHLPNVISRLQKALEVVQREASRLNVTFGHSDRLGFLTLCPTNLGSTLRASVHIKLPNLASDSVRFEEEAAKLNLQVRGTRGEHSQAESGIYDVSNKRRLGFTEAQLIKDLYDGCKKLIEIEKELEK